MSEDNLFTVMKLRQWWDILRPVHARLKPLLILIAFVQILQLTIPFVSKLIIDTFPALTATNIQPSYQLVGAVTLLIFVISALQFVRTRTSLHLMLIIEQELPVRAQAKLLALSLGYHERMASGKLISRVVKGVDRFEDLMASCLFQFIPIVVQTIGIALFLVYLEWRIALVFFPVIPLFLWLTYKTAKDVKPLRDRRYDGYDIANSQISQSLLSIKTVQCFGREAEEIATQVAIRKDIFEIEWLEWRTTVRRDFWRDQLITITRALLWYCSIWLLAHGHITVGSVVLFLTWSESTYLALHEMAQMLRRAFEWAESVDRLSLLLNEPLIVKEHPNARAIGPIEGRVTFQDVGFSYGGEKNALHNVSCEIEPGTTVALVGRSGCGKTSLANLLFRLYDRQSGRIEIDGHPIEELTLNSFRHQMAIVNQQVGIRDETVRENIRFSRPAATNDEVVEAAKLANAHGFITKVLPHGYDTVVGDRGIKLSGGQAQRLAIARALLANPKILVFDEATSSLDSESEHIIQAAMTKIQHQRTVIVIAHRLSTIRDADKILVFDHGRIVEQGNHEQLMALEGLYWRLYQHQHRHPHKEISTFSQR